MDSNRSKQYPLHRREVVTALLDHRDDMLVVAGLGASAWDITAARDSPLNFPCHWDWASHWPNPRAESWSSPGTVRC